VSRRFRERSGQRSISLLLAFLALIAGAAAWNWLRHRGNPVPAAATLSVLSGEVVVSRADAGQDPPLVVGRTTRLQSADELSLGADAKARLTFPGGETIDLGDSARLTLLELYEAPMSGALRASVALHAGSALTRARQMLMGGMRLTFETRVASVETQGAVFQCDIVSKNRIYVAVYDGAVAVSMGEQALDLTTGQGVYAELGQSLVPLVVTQPLPSQAAPSETAVGAAPTATPREQFAFPPIVTPTRPGDSANARLYTVQEGDTLFSISRQFGVSWEAIWEANRNVLTRPELLRAGQQLRIPAP